jgi:hypothetical protein
VDTLSIRTPSSELLPDDETPHGCYEGWVYLGHIVEGESGEPEEVIERVRCRRCNAGALQDVGKSSGPGEVSKNPGPMCRGGRWAG